MLSKSTRDCILLMLLLGSPLVAAALPPPLWSRFQCNFAGWAGSVSLLVTPGKLPRGLVEVHDWLRQRASIQSSNCCPLPVSLTSMARLSMPRSSANWLLWSVQ